MWAYLDSEEARAADDVPEVQEPVLGQETGGIMRELKTEEWLKSNGVEYTYESSVPLEKIMDDPKAKSQIRLGSAKPNADTVERYAIADKQGADFPAPILNQRNDKRFGVVGGNHRIAAKRRNGRTHTDAYLCALNENDKEQALVVSRLRRTQNGTEGVAPSRDELLEQAVQLVNEGMTAKDAAECCYLHAKAVQTHHRYQGSLARLVVDSGLTLRQVADMGYVAVTDLGTIAHPGFAKDATCLAHAAGLDGAEIKELSRQLRDANTDQRKAVILADWTTKLRTRIAQCKIGEIRRPVSPFKDLNLYAQKVRRAMSDERLRGLDRSRHAELLRMLKRLRSEVDSVIRKLEANGSNGKSGVHRAPVRHHA